MASHGFSRIAHSQDFPITYASRNIPSRDIITQVCLTLTITTRCIISDADLQKLLCFQTVQTVRQGETLKLADNLIGNKLTHAMTPSIPPRRSSEQSTLDLHRQIALQDSSNTVETVMKARQGSDGLHRALSAERDLHNKASAASSGMAQANDMGTSLPQPQQQPGQLLSSKVCPLQQRSSWDNRISPCTVYSVKRDTLLSGISP